MGALNLMQSTSLQSYAGYAWEFLRRNPSYRTAFERSRSHLNKPSNMKSGGSILRVKTISKAAEKWGLQCFSDPDESYLNAHVFWAHHVFTRALPIEFETVTASNLSKKSIQFSDIECTKQHLLTGDGRRETVLKSAHFWMQLYGYPPTPTKENGPIVVRVNGTEGLRKRLETLHFLAELRDKNPLEKLSTSQNNTFNNLQFYLQILDLKPRGMSYREMSALIVGEKRTRDDWDGDGCSLKSKMVRGATRAVKLMEGDYIKLLRR